MRRLGSLNLNGASTNARALNTTCAAVRLTGLTVGVVGRAIVRVDIEVCGTGTSIEDLVLMHSMLEIFCNAVLAISLPVGTR